MKTSIRTYLILLAMAMGKSFEGAHAVISPEAAAALADPTVRSLIRTNDSYPSTATGEAILKCKAGVNNIQVSNYGPDSWLLQNTGDKRIAAVFIDVTEAMFSDVVFDATGTGGDSITKPLTYDTGGDIVGAINGTDYPYLWLKARSNSFNGAAPFNPNDLSNVNNLFVDAVANSNKGKPKAGGGFRGQLLLFNNFTPTKQVGFSGDMDPNSLAGLSKGSVDLDAGWDVGGVSGAEMIGSVVTVIFGDGTSASATMAADGSQAGSIAVLTESGQPEQAPILVVNGISPGGSGTYRTNPSVKVSSDVGNMVRVTMAKGFDAINNTQTVANGAITIDALVAARLAAQYPEFPVNNAYSFQHQTVKIEKSGFLDVSSAFNVGPENLPIAWTAVVLNSAGEPISETSKPIRMVYSTAPIPVGSPPVTRPVASPVKSPVAPPVRPPVTSPVKPPVKAPVTPPVAILPPKTTPVAAPVRSPVAPPITTPVPPPTTVTKGITGLSLIDVDAPTVKIPITNNAVISIASVGGGPFTIDAQTIGSIGSVVFVYNGDKVQTENTAPYSFCGDDGTNFDPCNQFSAGAHTVTARAHPRTSGRGISFSNVTVTFTLIA